MRAATFVLAAALALPAAATTTYYGSITSTFGDVYVLVAPEVPGPMERWDSGCSQNHCAYGRIGGADGLQVLDLSEHAGYGMQSTGVGASFQQKGRVRVVATAPGAPSFVDFTIDLWLEGSSTGGNVGGNASATVDVNFATQGLMGGGGSGLYRTSQAWNTTPQTPLVQGLTPFGTHGLRGRLTHVAVGQWFELDTTLGGRVGTSGEAWAAISYGLSPVPFGPVAALPAGLSFESDDWAIVDNHWCPGGCAPVPEPPAALLALLGLAVLARRPRG